MKKEVKCCSMCGSKMVMYGHSMSVLLARSLDKFTVKSQGEEMGLREAGLTFSERTNFQKLKYFDLVSKGSKPGTWHITCRAIDFLNGKIMIPEKVITYRGKREKYDGGNIGISEIIPEGSKTREEYAREAMPINTGGEQLALCR